MKASYWMLTFLVPLVAVLFALWSTHSTDLPPPEKLEPKEGTAQCNYEMLRAFTLWIKVYEICQFSNVTTRVHPQEENIQQRSTQQPSLVYTLGAGTLLGAMRSIPSGLLKWEHDVDIYLPAWEAWEVSRRLEAQCGTEGGMVSASSWKSKWCETLWWRGHVEKDGVTPCCGFGYKIYHRGSLDRVATTTISLHLTPVIITRFGRM